MGSMVRAECLCGFERGVRIGGGMLNSGGRCGFPCLCGGCHDLVEVNLLAKRMKCPDCGSGEVVPYDDPSLAGSPGKEEVAGWNMRGKGGRKLSLTDGNYKCPRCGRMALRFEAYGFFD